MVLLIHQSARMLRLHLNKHEESSKCAHKTPVYKMSTVFTVCIVFLLVNFFGQTISDDNSTRYADETKLLKVLFKDQDYKKEVRPIHNDSTPIHVGVGFDLWRIDSLEAASDILTSSFVKQLSWKDSRLMWNTSEFGGIESIRLPVWQIWIPDIHIYNLAQRQEVKLNGQSIIFYNGEVKIYPLVTASTFCSMDITQFPYDTQTCHIIFGSWTHTSKELALYFFGRSFNDLNAEMNFPTESMTNQNQWKARSAKGTIITSHYECCPGEGYQVLNVTLRLERLPNFFRYVISWPSEIVCILIPFMFSLPADSPHKVTFGIGLIGIDVLIMILLETSNTFDHATVPRIAIFHLATLMTTTISLMLSFWIVGICSSSRRRRPVPAVLQRLLLNDSWIRKILLLQHHQHVFQFSNSNEHNLLAETSIHDEPSVGQSEFTTLGDRDTLRDLSESLRTISEHLSTNDAYDKVTRDWLEIGRVLDRILGIICFVVVIILLVSMTKI